MESTLKTQPIKAFALAMAFVSIAPTVRANKNGYPFLTFINKDNVAENVYFSKRASEHLEAGMPVTKEFLAHYVIADTKNEAGEPRVKLVSNTERIDLAGLLD